jgi:outer membrane protein assembly factor BamB
VVALFGSGTLVAFDTEGTMRWSTDLGTLNPGLLGDPKSEWGHASSPVIFEDLAIVQVDKHADSFMAAFDVLSGKPVWRIARGERPVWATPTLHSSSGRTELVVVGTSTRSRPRDGPPRTARPRGPVTLRRRCFISL